MKVTNIQSIYQKTIDFAAEKHGKQKMPNGLLYIVHLSNVAMEVFMAHKQKPDFNLEIAIQLALLHDVLEDTALSFKALEDDFGNVVAVLQKINIGHESVYERDSILNFNKGILISETIEDNKK